MVTRTSLCTAETAPPAVLTADTTLATEGYFVLSWSAVPAPDKLGLWQDSSAPGTDSVLRAEGLPATGSLTLTGLRDGLYTYRLLADGQPVGEPVSISVQHHAFRRALGFFALGLVLFLILVTSILRGRAAVDRQAGKTRTEQARAG